LFIAMLNALNWFLDIKKSKFLSYLSRVDNSSAFLFFKCQN
jgi:hypothetical protein